MVGRTPWSADDVPVGLLAPCKMLMSLFRQRDAGGPRGPGGPPRQARRWFSPPSPSQMPAAERRHQYLGGAGALFHADRLGSSEQTGFGGVPRRGGAHREIAGGQPVEQEAALTVGLGVARPITGFQLHYGGHGGADAAGIVGRVQIALKEQIGGDEAFQAARVVRVVLVEVEVGEIVACVGEAARAGAGAGGHGVGLLVVVGVDEIGFADLEVDTAVAERGPDLDRLRLGVVIVIVVVVVAELAAEDGLDAQADALAVVENPVEEFG